LGEFVNSVGQDWVIGTWVAETDEGQTILLAYTWSLDKCAIRTDFRMGEGRHQGLVMLSTDSEEVFDVGADNRGGVTKGTWTEDWDGLVHRMERTDSDGRVQKLEIVHRRKGADSMDVAMYSVDENGDRSAEPWSKLTYKRRAGTTPLAATSHRRTHSGYYQSLGDLVSEGGFEWLVGKWKATDEGRTYEVEYKPTLDWHAGVVDASIGDFKFHALITYEPYSQQIVQTGADSLGGIWKGTWDEDYAGAACRLEYSKPDGTKQKLEHVYIKVDNDTFRVKEYGVDSSGYRSAEARGTLTFRRQ
jgi:hypothetical protein